MASYEDRDTQAKQYWQNRLAHERLNISESVEETLADASSQEQWSEDEQQYVSIDHSSSSTEIVPPRLSLQSKVLPTVQSASFVQSVTAEIAAQQAVAKVQEERQKPQNTNILTRFAQRFTSSLAAFGAAMQPDVPTWSPTPKECDENLPQERQLSTTPPMHGLTPFEEVQMLPATFVDAIPAIPSNAPAQPVKSKQRLAGHTGKVRLQNAPTAKARLSQAERDVKDWNQEKREPLREPLVVNVRLRERVQEVSLPDLSTGTILREEVQHEKQNGHVEKDATITPITRCTSFFGTGTFESGQGEIMVKNTHTTDLSVVHVALTSNPGPTLVQYISLHPEIGFTLHLTAPVTAKTTFNYVLLVDMSAETL